METKRCKKCNFERDVNDFYLNSDSGKKMATCKPCRRKYQIKYYSKNREKVLKKTKEYYHKNKELMQEYNEEWRMQNAMRAWLYNQKAYKQLDKNHRKNFIMLKEAVCQQGELKS